jgi:hypothetical protein
MNDIRGPGRISNGYRTGVLISREQIIALYLLRPLKLSPVVCDLDLCRIGLNH